MQEISFLFPTTPLFSRTQQQKTKQKNLNPTNIWKSGSKKNNGFGYYEAPVLLGHGLPTIRCRTHFTLKEGECRELGLKIRKREVWECAKVETLWTLEGERRLRVGLRDSLRALRAGGAIGVRWETLNMLLPLANWLREKQKELCQDLSVYCEPSCELWVLLQVCISA